MVQEVKKREKTCSVERKKVRKVLRKGKSLNFAGKVLTFSATLVAQNMSRLRNHNVVFTICLAGLFSFSQPVGEKSSAIADLVKTEFRHAWNAYKKYAWGHDALKPLSKQSYDWYGSSLLLICNLARHVVPFFE